MTTELPDLRNPPVVEVALTTQFSPMPEMQGVHLGLFWGLPEIRNSFPLIETHPPLDQVIEKEGITPGEPSVRVQIIRTPPCPRYFLTNESRTQLIQLQPDRISHNWRKVGDGDAYPRYEGIREDFKRELELLRDFVVNEKIGSLSPNQCEIAYVNHIEMDSDVSSKVRAADLIGPWDGSFTQLAGAELESLRLDAKHIIRDEAGDFQGRLHVSLSPAVRSVDKRPIYVLQLTARGKPLGDGIEGALAFLDHGRQLLGRGFLELTTERMQQIWGRQ